MENTTTLPTEVPAIPPAPPGLSVWERRVFDHLVQHAEREKDALALYGTLTVSTTSEATRYLARLILDEEARHHRMLAALAQTIAGFPKPGPVPVLDHARDPALAAAARKLLEFEHEDRSRLSKLAKELKPVATTSLWGLIVDMLIADTDKHIRILRFIEDHALRGTR
jgi:hypothetical protein